jgi:putative flippase GtrA
MSAAFDTLDADVSGGTAQAAGLWALARFIAVGGGGTIAFIALSSFFVGLGTAVPAWMVNALCYAALIGPVYLLHRRFSFQSDAAHRQSLPRYVAVQACSVALVSVLSLVLQSTFALAPMIAATLVSVLTVGINFAVMRSWAFARGQMLPATA